MHTLATAHEHRLENIIDQLLQDFLQVWPDDYSSQFVDECLPLLFNIFRYSKVGLVRELSEGRADEFVVCSKLYVWMYRFLCQCITQLYLVRDHTPQKE